MRKISLLNVASGITFKDGKLFMGNMEVVKQNDLPYGANTLPALYMIRVITTHTMMGDKVTYPRVVTGLDLMKDGSVWLGPYPVNMWKDGSQVTMPAARYSDFATVKRILDELCSDTAGKEWGIYEEEDFDAFQED